MIFKNIIEKIQLYRSSPTVADIKKWTVLTDASKIIVQGPKTPPPILWADVQRIAFVTTDAGPVAPDYFLAFQVKNSPDWIMIPLDIGGASKLQSHVLALPGIQLGPKGTLVNSTANDSVVIWPSEDSGKKIDDLLA